MLNWVIVNKNYVEVRNNFVLLGVLLVIDFLYCMWLSN